MVASTVDGSVKSELQLSIVGGSEAASNSTDNSNSGVVDTTEVAETEPEKQVKAPKEAKPKERVPRERKPRTTSAESTWLRTSVGYNGGFYSYQQVPTSTTGLLYEKAITFNNTTEGSSPSWVIRT